MYRRQACTKLGSVVSCAPAGMVVATILKQHQVCLYVNIQFCIKFQLAIYLCQSETRVVVMSVAIFSSNFHCVHYIRTCAVCVCFSVHMCMHIAFLTPVILLVANGTVQVSPRGDTCYDFYSLSILYFLFVL